LNFLCWAFIEKDKKGEESEKGKEDKNYYIIECAWYGFTSLRQILND
jgi:hypothetical protein